MGLLSRRPSSAEVEMHETIVELSAALDERQLQTARLILRDPLAAREWALHEVSRQESRAQQSHQWDAEEARR